MMELTREQQIAFMEGAPERLDAYVRKRLADPAFRNALHAMHVRLLTGTDISPADSSNPDLVAVQMMVLRALERDHERRNKPLG